MKEFKVTYTRVKQQVLFMILFPSIFMLLIIFALIPANDIPDWAILAIIFAAMGFMILVFLAIFFRYLIVDSIVTIDEKSIDIRILKRTPFFLKMYLATGYDNIRNASMDYDAKAGRSFILLQLRKPALDIILSTRKDEAVLDELWKEMERNIQNYNSAHGSQPDLLIKNQSFWGGWMIRAIAIIAGILAIGATYSKIADPQSIQTWKLIALYCAVIPLWISMLSAKR